jgi:CBS domain-containing protein
MSARAVTTTPETEMAEIADMMLRYNVRSVPVVDGRGIVGIVSRRDILRAAMGGDEVVTKDVRAAGGRSAS